MARRLSWSDVRGGLIACALLILGALAILKFSRVGALRGETFPLYASVGDASGVMKGSEVWLSGQKIGKITDIHFRSPQVADTLHRVAIDMDILSAYRSALRSDAVGQIRPGGSFIGPAVVYLTPGTQRGSEIRPGDTIRMREAPDFGRAATQLGVATQDVPVILTNVQVLRAELQTTKGTIGAMMNEPGLGELGRARIHVARLVGTLHGNGTVGRVLQGDVVARARLVMAQADSVRALVSSPTTSLGRFRRDSTLFNEVGAIRAELARVDSLLESPYGTVGRFTRDSSITLQVEAARTQMTLLFADLKKHPFRYLSF